MKRTLSEQKVLKELKIDNFRQLSKDTVMKFASSIHRMDPEVAKKALEQFPEFASAVGNAITEYKDTAVEIISNGNSDHKDLIEMIKAEHQALLDMLSNDDLTLEQKFQILDRITDLQDRVEKENREMRHYRFKVFSAVAAVVSVGVLTLGTVLGGNTEISRNDESEDEM